MRGPEPVLASLAASALGAGRGEGGYRAFRCRQLAAACWGPPVTRAHPPGTPWHPTTHLSPDTDRPHSGQATAKGSAPWDPTADAASGPEAHALLTFLATNSGFQRTSRFSNLLEQHRILKALKVVVLLQRVQTQNSQQGRRHAGGRGGEHRILCPHGVRCRPSGHKGQGSSLGEGGRTPSHHVSSGLQGPIFSILH